jgi:hypothetical protein
MRTMAQPHARRPGLSPELPRSNRLPIPDSWFSSENEHPKQCHHQTAQAQATITTRVAPAQIRIVQARPITSADHRGALPDLRSKLPPSSGSEVPRLLPTFHQASNPATTQNQSVGTVWKMPDYPVHGTILLKQILERTSKIPTRRQAMTLYQPTRIAQ